MNRTSLLTLVDSWQVQEKEDGVIDLWSPGGLGFVTMLLSIFFPDRHESQTTFLKSFKCL